MQAGPLRVLSHMFQNTLDRILYGSSTEDYDVGMRLGGPHVTLGHGSDRGMKLLDDRLRRTAAFAHITLLATLQTDVIRHVNVDSGAQQAAEFRPMQREKPVDDHEGCGLKRLRQSSTGVDGEIVRRYFNGPALRQLHNLGYEQFVIESGRIVEIGAGTLLHRHMGEVAIIVIEGQHRCMQACGKVASKITLPCPRRPGNANEIGALGHAAPV